MSAWHSSGGPTALRAGRLDCAQPLVWRRVVAPALARTILFPLLNVLIDQMAPDSRWRRSYWCQRTCRLGGRRRAAGGWIRTVEWPAALYAAMALLCVRIFALYGVGCQDCLVPLRSPRQRSEGCQPWGSVGAAGVISLSAFLARVHSLVGQPDQVEPVIVVIRLVWRDTNTEGEILQLTLMAWVSPFEMQISLA